MIELDLHGISHSQVQTKVEDWVLGNQHKLPLRIIIGNSNPMKNLTTEILDKHNFKWFIPAYNLGEIIVTG